MAYKSSDLTKEEIEKVNNILKSVQGKITDRINGTKENSSRIEELPFFDGNKEKAIAKLNSNVSYLRETLINSYATPFLLSKLKETDIINGLWNALILDLSARSQQIYFIPTKYKLEFKQSYFGVKSVLLRSGAVKMFEATVYYPEDVIELKIQNGMPVLDEVNSKFDLKARSEALKGFSSQKDVKSASDLKFEGAYAVLQDKNNVFHYEFMDKEEIFKAFSSTNAGNIGKSANDWPDQMAKRTVMNRLAKNFTNTMDIYDEKLSLVADANEKLMSEEVENAEIEKANDNNDNLTLEHDDVINPLEALVNQKETNATNDKKAETTAPQDVIETNNDKETKTDTPFKVSEEVEIKSPKSEPTKEELQKLINSQLIQIQESKGTSTKETFKEALSSLDIQKAPSQLTRGDLENVNNKLIEMRA